MFKLSNNREHIVTAIRGVEGVIRDNMSGISIFDAEDVWRELGPLCQPKNGDNEILYRSVKCLEAFTVTTDPDLYNSEQLDRCYNVFVNLLGSFIYTRKSQMAFKVSSVPITNLGKV